jgi:hypothetical protein
MADANAIADSLPVHYNDDDAVSDIYSIDVALSDLSITTSDALWDPEEAEEYKKFI